MRLALALLATVFAIGPGGFLFSGSPRLEYLFALRRDGVDASPTVQAWLRAADDAVRAAPALPLPLPLREDGVFVSSAPAAAAYAVRLSRGRRLSIAVRAESDPLPFVDLLRVVDGEPPSVVASLRAGRTSLVHDVEADGIYVTRLQPPIGAGGAFAIAQRTRPSLGLPLGAAPGGPARSPVGGGRDAGRRRHEGIDLFAPRGTPVIAVRDGLARTATNRLGGNVVWLHAPLAGQVYYYAHLDRWAVGPLALVRAGDVLGYVGNTGNARTTPPHLHFGVYQDGAIDPWPFVEPEQPVAPGPDTATPRVTSTDRRRRGSGRHRRA
jgi:murein DD-endopeptidase MepM/ murein hydrolase activator NlpD